MNQEPSWQEHWEEVHRKEVELRVAKHAIEREQRIQEFWERFERDDYLKDNPETD